MACSSLSINTDLLPKNYDVAPCERLGKLSLNNEIQLVDKGIPVIPKNKSKRVFTKVRLNDSLSSGLAIDVQDDIIACSDTTQKTDRLPDLRNTNSIKQINCQNFDYSKYNIKRCDGETVSLKNAILELNKSLYDILISFEFGFKTFLFRNEDLISKIYALFIKHRHIGLSLDNICQVLLNNESYKIRLSNLKAAFKSTYRRMHIVRPQLNDLIAAVQCAFDALEPGEDVAVLWDDNISITYQVVLAKKYKNILKMTSHKGYTINAIEMFVLDLVEIKKVWPSKMMTTQLLREKSYNFLKLNPYAEVYAKFHKHRLELEEAFDMGLLSSMNCDACKFKPHSILGLLGHMTSPSHLKNSYEVHNKGPDNRDLCAPCSLCNCTFVENKDMVNHCDTIRHIDRVTKQLRKRLRRKTNKAAAKRKSDTKSEEPLKPHKKISYKLIEPWMSEDCLYSGIEPEVNKWLHRSDKNVHRSQNSKQLESSSNNRQKRLSNECAFNILSKKPRLDGQVHKQNITEYNKKLLSFKVWDPLLTIKDAPFKKVFHTKENGPVMACGIADISLSEPNHSRKCDDFLKNNWNVGYPYCHEIDSTEIYPDEMVNVAKSEAEIFETGLKKHAKQKSSKETLELEYGGLTFNLSSDQICDADVSVTISVQGYVFEGVATSQEEALECASYKALLLAPYLFEKLATSPLEKLKFIC